MSKRGVWLQTVDGQNLHQAWCVQLNRAVPRSLYLISQLIGTIHHLNLDLHVVNDITEGKGETSERLLWPEPDVSAGVKPRNSVY